MSPHQADPNSIKKQKPLVLRKVLIGAIIAIFAYISIVFIHQFVTYQKVRERLDAAYASGRQQSTALYRLFSIYGEADNLFRQYTVDFNKDTYRSYQEKLDTIHYYVDSLAALPSNNALLGGEGNTLKKRNELAQEFASLKKTVGDLVFMAQDSLYSISQHKERLRTPASLSADSVISKILSDPQLNQVQADTLVRKKQNLIKRIFNAKNDTLVTNTQQFNVQQIDVLQRNVENLISHNKIVYNRSLRELQRNFTKLRQKERDLIQANYALLNNLKIGVDHIRSLEQAAIRNAEIQDLALYRENAQQFGQQLLTSLVLMLGMIVFILYYQTKATSYEKKLQKEKDYAAKVAEEKTSVLANISHEVRTPINALMGIIDILRKRADKSLIQPEYLNSAAQEINVINSTVNDILNLSKLEVGALQVKNEYLSPAQLMQDIVNLHHYQARKKGLSLSLETDLPAKLQVFGSPFHIKQIVSNLISNAIKYTPHGSIRVKTYLNNSKGKESLCVAVSDTGLGIAPEHQAQIFRQYYMTDNKSKSKGFGLGLYISKLLAQQLQGDIRLQSVPAKGSTFTLEVPIVKKRIEKEATKRYSLADLPKDISLVLIDDNKINIMYLKHYFKDFTQVRSYEDAREALAYIEQQPVAAVITDMSMPDLDGWDVLRHIRENKTLAQTKVFAFTADNLLLEQSEKKNWGYTFDSVLQKPLDEQQFVSKIVKSEE